MLDKDKINTKAIELAENEGNEHEEYERHEEYEKHDWEWEIKSEFFY